LKIKNPGDAIQPLLSKPFYIINLKALFDEPAKNEKSWKKGRNFERGSGLFVKWLEKSILLYEGSIRNTCPFMLLRQRPDCADAHDR
jgi:hypothetical protein